MVKRRITLDGSSLLGFRRASRSVIAPPSSPAVSSSGFTLLELIIVMAVIGILAAIAIPSYTANVKHAREAVLREDLHTMRQAIDSFTYDKQKAPQGGDELVQAGYLREIPKDPITQRRDTWIFDQSGSLTTIDETQGGIDDVHSGSQQVSSEGTTYNTW